MTSRFLPVLMCVLAACAGSVAQPGPPPPSRDRAAYTLHDAKPPKAAPDILLIYDMEGLWGQSDWRSFLHDYPKHYAQGREQLIADVNAARSGPSLRRADLR